MAVESLTIRSISDYEDGRAWGDAGPFEVVRGVVTFAVVILVPAAWLFCARFGIHE